MGCYQVKSPFAFYDQIATWELACKGWLSHLRFPIVGRVTQTTTL
jgi:hypothetical protein